MDKKGITIKMSKDAGITYRQAEKAFQSLILNIIDSLKKEERVTFSRFGSFEVKHRKARTGRNPKTGETVRIPPKNRIKFNPSRIFKDQIS